MKKVRTIFGKLKNWKRSTKQIMIEIDKEIDSKIFRYKTSIKKINGK